MSGARNYVRLIATMSMRWLARLGASLPWEGQCMGRFMVRFAASVVVGISLLASQVGLASASPPTAAHGMSSAHSAPPRRAPVLRLKDAPRPLGVFKVVKVGRSAAKAGMRPSSATGPAATPAAPFTQCPAIGADASCGILVNVTDSGSQILADATQGPYDGSDDTLIGVLNSSGTAVGSLTLSSNTEPFAFDGDGICTYTGWTGATGCPYGSTGYEGPGTGFTGITPDFNGGIVVLSPALQPGQSAYFSLEEPLTGSQVTAGGPTAPEQGGASNPSENPTTCSTPRPVNCATGR